MLFGFMKKELTTGLTNKNKKEPQGPRKMRQDREEIG
jgi:hypothetical protein